jgi:ligand-binding sensor domain-containing protein
MQAKLIMAKIIRRLILLLVLIDAAVYGQPLNLKFEHITSENGLPQNTIHGIAKDKYGFMWFGTWSGLCRYDGYTFKTYHHDPNNPRSISNNRIHNVITDSDGNIWVVAFDDLVYSRYNYETDDFERVPKLRISQHFQALMNRRNHLNTISATFKGNRWTIDFHNNSLVQAYLPAGKKARVLADPGTRDALDDSYVTDLYLDDQQIIWVGTYSNGINKANLNAKPFGYFHHNPLNPNSIVDNKGNPLCSLTCEGMFDAIDGFVI